jgi:hypothetical protein
VVSLFSLCEENLGCIPQLAWTIHPKSLFCLLSFSSALLLRWLSGIDVAENAVC